MQNVLSLAGIELFFFIVASMGCFQFSLDPVLIIQGCFTCHWAVLTKNQGLLCFLPIKLPLSQPTSFLTLTLVILPPHPTGGKWVSGCTGLSCQLRLNYDTALLFWRILKSGESWTSMPCRNHLTWMGGSPLTLHSNTTTCPSDAVEFCSSWNISITIQMNQEHFIFLKIVFSSLCNISTLFYCIILFSQ